MFDLLASDKGKRANAAGSDGNATSTKSNLEALTAEDGQVIVRSKRSIGKAQALQDSSSDLVLIDITPARLKPHIPFPAQSLMEGITYLSIFIHTTTTTNA